MRFASPGSRLLLPRAARHHEQLLQRPSTSALSVSLSVDQRRKLCVKTSSPRSATGADRRVQRVDDYNDTLYSLPTMKRDPAALLPLTPAMFQVLIALAD